MFQCSILPNWFGPPLYSKQDHQAYQVVTLHLVVESHHSLSGHPKMIPMQDCLLATYAIYSSMFPYDWGGGGGGGGVQRLFICG